MKALAIKILPTPIFFIQSTLVFGQGQGAYHDAIMEEKNGSGGGIITGLLIIIAILYFTSDKNRK